MSGNRNQNTEYRVSVDQLCIGVYIRLTGIRWFDHPFFFNDFKITKREQIQALKSIGVSTVICVPEKSDALPGQPEPIKVPETGQPSAEDRKQARALWEIKQKRIKLNTERQAKARECEEHFKTSVQTVRNVMQNIEVAPEEAFQEADGLMKKIVESLMAEKDVALSLMNTKIGEASVFFHSLNVSVLAMILGKECGLTPELLRIIGLGALFHDIGKNNVPKSILRKKNLSTPERRFLQLHPRYGLDILSKIRNFPKEALQIVYEHHERCDGHGYPEAVAADRISSLARITSIVDTYDNHCNKFDYRESLTPYESLAYMFSVQGDRFDKDALSRFIRCLGVYPPGTIVKLSNGGFGMIVEVDPKKPLQPTLLLYDPAIPKKEALVFSLQEEPNLSIVAGVRPLSLPQKVYEYLSPRTRVTYYLNQSALSTDINEKA